jgi:hypothetical protein
MSRSFVADAPLPRRLLLGVALLGVVLTATVVPAPFIIDDINYLTNVVALRQGRVTLPSTDGLTPSAELVFFDPAPEKSVVTSTPVASNAPPLYAPLALPFSVFGWRGLVALNTFAYVATVVLLFVYARRFATEQTTPYAAAGAFALGGFVIEYAQGLWPHAVSIALCTGGIVAVGRVIDGGRVPLAALAGMLLGVAAGIRYQNAIIVCVAATALWLWSTQRWRAIAAYGAAAAVPLSASALINHARLGSWNPISKGPGYLNVPVPGEGGGSLFDPLLMFWARVVDFSARPPLVGPAYTWVRYDETTGAHLIFGDTVQKALLQSAPWAVLALMLLALAWLPRIEMPERRRRQLQMLSLIAGAVIATFALSGRWRHEGAAYNQRYFLELVPIAAVAFAWALDGLQLRARPLAVGALWGLLPAVLFLQALTPGPVRSLALLKFPLVIAGALAVTWIAARSRESARPALAGLAGVALGWGFMLHVGDDVAASRGVKRDRLAQTEALRRALPDRSGLVTYWGSRDAAGSLLLERNIIILDAHADEGRDAPALIGELLDQGRRVFVIQNGMPAEVLSRVYEGWEIGLSPERRGIVELRAKQE